jgi:hypothetical protein
MNMQLTLDQSLLIYINRFKEIYVSSKFKYTSKFPYKCLNCGDPIYVPFDGATRKDIFCQNCKDLAHIHGDKKNPQLYYLNEIKEKQLPIILSSVPDPSLVNLEGMSMLKPYNPNEAKPVKLISF